MKKIIIFLLLSVKIFSETYPDDILYKIDNLANFLENDFSSEYTIVQDIPNKSRQTTIAAVFRRDSKETYTIVIKKPDSSNGQAYLKQKNTLWFYDPESRRFNSTSSKERFQNSNARNSDFTRSTLSIDYTVISGEDVELGVFDCWKLTLNATSDEVTYPKMVLWVSKDNLVRKSEDYSLSNKLLRTTIIPVYHNLTDKYFPKTLLYVDHLKGSVVNGVFKNERTQITIDKISLKDLPDSVFSKPFIENLNK